VQAVFLNGYKVWREAEPERARALLERAAAVVAARPVMRLRVNREIAEACAVEGVSLTAPTR